MTLSAIPRMTAPGRIPGRQLVSMTKSGTTAAFAYNADALRIRKTVNGTVTDYTLHGKQVVHVKQGSNNLHFFYDAQGRPTVVDFNSVKYGYVHNLQGDVVAVIDGSGTQVVEYTYDAWGKQLTKTGTLAATLGTLNPFRYRGYVFDEETGLYYLRSRYYNPTWGRFVSADTVLGKPGKLLDHNLFSYCRQNPVMGRDPSGMYDPDERAEQQRQRAAARKAKQAVDLITQAVLGKSSDAFIDLRNGPVINIYYQDKSFDQLYRGQEIFAFIGLRTLMAIPPVGAVLVGLGYFWGKYVGPRRDVGITIEQQYSSDRTLLTMIGFQYESEGVTVTSNSSVDILYVMHSTIYDFDTMPTMNLSDLTDYDVFAWVK